MRCRRIATNAVELIGEWGKNLLTLSLPATKQTNDGSDGQTRSGLPLSRWKTRYIREIDGEMADIVERHRSGRWAVIIKPPEEADKPLEAAQRVLRTVFGEHPRFSVEIAEVDDLLQYRIIVFSRKDADNMVNRIMSLTDCKAEIEERPAMSVQKGDYAAISRISYSLDSLFPVKHSDSNDFDEPYKPLLDTISGEWDAQTNIQIICEPSDDWATRWSRGVPIETKRNFLLGPPERGTRLPGMAFTAILTATVVGWWILDTGAVTVARAAASLPLTAARAALLGVLTLTLTGLWVANLFGHGFGPRKITAKGVAELMRSKPWTENKPTKSERADIDPVARQGSSPGYRVSMRVLSTADNPQTAARYQTRVCRSIRNSWHNTGSGQRFVENPVGWPTERSFRKMLHKIAARAPDRQRRQRISDKLLFRSVRPFPMYMADFELSSLCHWPGRKAGAASLIEYTAAKTDDPSAKAKEFRHSDDPTEPTPEPDEAEPIDEQPVDLGPMTEPTTEPTTEPEPEPIEVDEQ